MEKISSTAELKNAIQLLEAEQNIKWQLLKEQFVITREGLKPINLLKNAFKDMASSPNLINNILGTVMGLATGYFSNKLVVGASTSIVRRLIGSILQIGVAASVAKHPDGIKSFGQKILQYILRKKELISKKL